jgi:ankyrin repeat protein
MAPILELLMFRQLALSGHLPKFYPPTAYKYSFKSSQTSNILRLILDSNNLSTIMDPLLELLRQASQQPVRRVSKTPKQKLAKWGIVQDSPLWKLVSGLLSNSEPTVRAVLNEHPDLVNATFGNSKTPLLRAFESGKHHMVRTLLQLGADPNVMIKINQDELPILHSACLARAFAMLQLLLDAGANIHEKDSRGRTLLENMLLRIKADENDPLPLFRKIVEYAEETKQPFDLNAKDSVGDTLLFSATAYRFTAVVDYLIRKGVDLNLQNEKGLTALHMAAMADHQDIVDLLLFAGAKTDLTDCDGNIPIISAGPTRRSLIAMNYLVEYNKLPRLQPRDHPVYVAPSGTKNAVSAEDSSDVVD